ncbi:MAG TPA: sigma-54 dependent transcriptional regulator [Syntrophorhabdaceae bacterium]|jgi:two-component system NtrC family response regulator
MANVLIIDDDEIISEMLSDMVSIWGHHPETAATLQDGVDKARGDSFDVVFLDIRLPDGSGLDVLPVLREVPSSPEIIIITGYGDPDGAELAIKNGAWDYIEKSSSIKEMELPFVRAIQYRQEKRSKMPPVSLKREGIIGSSPQMQACLDFLAQTANSDANAFIFGETGTGKELFARAIHDNSMRAHRNFVVVDCASFPETLVESILFGHERGAFTGADKAQDGLIKQAHGGTLFLDEIGELPASIQKTFLRVLQEHRFRTVGGKQEIESQFRLISATNKDLVDLASRGIFREDLLFRLRTLGVELPPLRTHKEDIKELAIHFVTKICERYGTGIKGFSADFLEALMTYDWPGNVRELINALERAISASYHEPTLFPKHLPTEIRVSLARASVFKESPQEYDTKPASSRLPLQPLKEFRDAAVARAEKGYLEDLIRLSAGNIKEACRISGLSRPRLYALLKQYNLKNLKRESEE